jgi:hypothetical protein
MLRYRPGGGNCQSALCGFGQGENTRFGNSRRHQLRDTSRGRNLQLTGSSPQSRRRRENHSARHLRRSPDYQHTPALLFIIIIIRLRQSETLQ